jgi:hypothetical protein
MCYACGPDAVFGDNPIQDALKGERDTVRKLRDFGAARASAEKEPFNPLPDIHRLEEVKKQIGTVTDPAERAMLENDATRLRLKLYQSGAVELLGGATKGVSTTAVDIAAAKKALDEAPDAYAAQTAAQKLTTLRLKAAYSGEAFKAEPGGSGAAKSTSISEAELNARITGGVSKAMSTSVVDATLRAAFESAATAGTLAPSRSADGDRQLATYVDPVTGVTRTIMQSQVRRR